MRKGGKEVFVMGKKIARAWMCSGSEGPSIFGTLKEGFLIATSSERVQRVEKEEGKGTSFVERQWVIYGTEWKRKKNREVGR